MLIAVFSASEAISTRRLHASVAFSGETGARVEGRVPRFSGGTRDSIPERKATSRSLLLLEAAYRVCSVRRTGRLRRERHRHGVRGAVVEITPCTTVIGAVDQGGVVRRHVATQNDQASRPVDGRRGQA